MDNVKRISYGGWTSFLFFLAVFQIFNVAMSIKVERVSEAIELGEGPHWDVKTQKLYFVDILAQKILRLDPASGKVTSVYLKEGPVGVAVPVEGTKDKLVVGCGRDVFIVTWDGESDVIDPPIEKLVSLETDRTDTRVNDGKCDPAGRFWIGTMAIEVNKVITPNRGALYVVGSDASLKQVLSPISISNGLTWSLQNNTMYYIDSTAYQVWGFDYNNANGLISYVKGKNVRQLICQLSDRILSPANKRVIFDLKKNNVKGLPDGMTIDADGNLWIALFGGGAVIQVDPRSGKLLQKIDLPADQVTSVVFGGKELDILFVTTAYVNLSTEEKNDKPESGSLYAIRNLGIKGTPSTNFKYQA